MQRPGYLNNYQFNWELFDVIIGGKSAVDSTSFLVPIKGREDVGEYLNAYGFNHDDPVLRAELFGNLQEAIQFIKRYCLKDGNADGLDLSFPNSIYAINDVSELFMMAAGQNPKLSYEDSLWAGIILKVMHTILHADKDLRSNYFSIVQQQIFDRFYKFIYREEGKLFLRSPVKDQLIEIVTFETKSKKSRDSVIIKLLHKAENVAEEVFDRIGVRIVTYTRFDTLKIVRFMHDNHVIVGHNIKPSRSRNNLIDLVSFKKRFRELQKQAIRNNLSEKEFLIKLEKEAVDCSQSVYDRDYNPHTLKNYRSIQFTCRQLIRYQNPFVNEFKVLRTMAKETAPDSELTKKILSLDTSTISKDIRFFYPFEVQIVDQETHQINTAGEASHEIYKKMQLKTAIKRLFRPIIEFKNIAYE